MGSAFVNHQEDTTGSIEMGKQADLVVLDQNVFDADASEFASIDFGLTMVGGEIVYASGAFRGLDAALE